MKYLEQYYVEKYLASEITFGFEFEFITKMGDDLKVLNIINRYFPENKIRDLDSDSSINPDDEGTEEGFEWQSPVMNVNMKNIQRVVKFFEEINAKKVYYINDSCGFHVHLGYPKNNDSVSNSLWFILNLCSDEKYFEEISYFKDLEFFSEDYADRRIIRDLSTDIEEVTEKEDTLRVIFDFLRRTGKFDVFNFHPQGTLEWRGPRNFVDNNALVKGFFVKKLFMFTLWLTNILNKNTITLSNGVTLNRKEIDDYTKLNIHTIEQNLGRHDHSSRRRTMMSRKEKVDMIIKYPFLSHKNIRSPILYILEAKVEGQMIPIVFFKRVHDVVIKNPCCVIAQSIENSVLENCYITTDPKNFLNITDSNIIKMINDLMSNIYYYQTVSVAGRTLKNCKIDSNVYSEYDVNII